jgi:hypothetical protein
MGKLLGDRILQDAVVLPLDPVEVLQRLGSECEREEWSAPH